MSTPAMTPTRVVQLLGERDHSVPAYRWLADSLRLLIADGRIALGHALPSERRLSEALGASRTTVTRAYSLLVDSGFLRARHGSGHLATLPSAGHWVGVGGALIPGTTDDDGVIDLTCAASRAPAGTAEAYAAALANLPAFLGGTGYATAGLPALREAIAARYTERGLRTDADQILVVSGALAGFGLVVRALTRPTDKVLVESPSYPNALDAVRRVGAHLVPLPVDPQGWDLDLAAATIASARPVLACLILDFHNPTGALLDDEGRSRLAASLHRTGTVAVVDETMLEVRLDEAPRPLPFAAHLSKAVLIGSASKSHWGGLRVGWVRAPHRLLPQLTRARLADDLGAPIFEQLALVELLAQGHGLHPERAQQLRSARAVMEAALPSALPSSRWIHPAGGLSLWVELPDPRANQLAAAAREDDLLVSPGPQFAATHGLQRYVRLPYKDPPEVVSEAMVRLARAWRRQQSLPDGPVASRPRPVVA